MTCALSNPKVGAQLDQIMADLQAQKHYPNSWSIRRRGTVISLEANGNFSSVDEIGEILTLVQSTGELVRLKDLLTVRRGYVDPQQEPIYFNGEPALLLFVEMNASKDIQKIGVALKKRVQEVENTQPIGISYRFSTYQETNVTDSIDNALSNVVQTFIVVLVILMLFLGLRPALVVVEDMQNKVREGLAPEQAALATGKQFFIPLAVSSVTTVSAFIPMLILEGSTGEFACSLGAVVALMLLGSWFTALYILPFIAARFRVAHLSMGAGESGIVKVIITGEDGENYRKIRKL